MKLYTDKLTHDDSPICACEECRNKKGRDIFVKTLKEKMPWGKEEKQVEIEYKLMPCPEGYAYVDKNILKMMENN